ncbi:hypothetical protein [Endozoicomonas ascidiicola]|uniref:hypothetical protein n=1 Tax=Endozoicomonas ascidiicola TaxID=1698521 RepID=UPI0008307367|nr:hypothetical protein [Endozoicomonas ascidiicola]
MDGSSSVGSSTTTSTVLPHGLNEDRLSALRAAGYNDAQIEALLSLSDPDDEGNSLTPTHFYSANRAALQALAYSEDSDATNVAYVQAPVALMQEVSDPTNWKGDRYIGPAAETVNRYLTETPVESSRLTLEALAFAVLTARADIVQEQLEQQINVVNQRNDTLRQATSYIVEARGLRDAAPSNMPVAMNEFWTNLGLTVVGTNPLSEDDWNQNIRLFNSQAESLTSQSQLETTQIQQTIAKYNQSFEMLSNFTNKYFQSLTAATQNLR